MLLSFHLKYELKNFPLKFSNFTAKKSLFIALASFRDESIDELSCMYDISKCLFFLDEAG